MYIFVYEWGLLTSLRGNTLRTTTQWNIFGLLLSWDVILPLQYYYFMFSIRRKKVKKKLSEESKSEWP